MEAEHNRVTETGTLEGILEDRIEERTGGSVRHLRVRREGEHVVVEGETPSYYLKQLAIQAVLDVRKSAGPWPLNVAISVQPRERALR